MDRVDIGALTSFLAICYKTVADADVACQKTSQAGIDTFMVSLTADSVETRNTGTEAGQNIIVPFCGS